VRHVAIARNKVLNDTKRDEKLRSLLQVQRRFGGTYRHFLLIEQPAPAKPKLYTLADSSVDPEDKSSQFSRKLLDTCQAARRHSPKGSNSLALRVVSLRARECA
jgi:hypothetical protein